MDFITTIIIVVAGIYLWGKYWANDSEKDARQVAEYYQERIESLKQTNLPFAKQRIKDYEQRTKRLGKFYEEYIHLLEKHGHASFINKWNLRQDWRMYLQAHKDIQQSDMDYGAGLSEKYLMKAKEREYRAEIRLNEIENRFKKLL